MTARVRILSGLAGAPALWDETIAELTCLLPGVPVEVGDVPWQAQADGRWAEPGWDPRQAVAPLVRSSEVLVAHSFAASLALAHLSDPARVQPRAAVLVSPFYRPSAADFEWSTLEHFLLQFDRFLETGLLARATHHIDPEIRRAMARSVRDRMGAYGWMAFMSAYLATPAADVSQVSVPVHVVYGSVDGVAPPADAVDLARALPRAVVHRAELADHFPMASDPALVAGAVRDAVARSAPRALHHLGPAPPAPPPPRPSSRRSARTASTTRS